MKIRIYVMCAALGVALLNGQSSSTEDQNYDAGTRAMNEGRWTDAENFFRLAGSTHGPRSDGAIYWRAYAQNKLGETREALRTCALLRQSDKQSQWLKECGALEIEIRKGSGTSVGPEGETDDDLKLLALNALMQQEPERALPIAKSMLTGNHSEKIKERALFVIAQSQSKDAQDLLTQFARGDADPALQVKAIHMMAAMQGKRASPWLEDLYRSSHDIKVKKTILQAYLATGDHDRLLEAARTETDPQLVRTAAQTLGAMGAAQDLVVLYRSASVPETKAAILGAFMMCGDKGQAALEEILKSEQDPGLREKAIRSFGISSGAAAGPALLTIYQKSADQGSKGAALDALFMSGDAHDLIAIAKGEKDSAMRRRAVEKLSMMHNKEATEYMIEILNK